MTMATARAYPATLRDHHRDRLINHFLLGDGTLGFFDHSAACVTELFAVSFNFLNQQFFHRSRIIEQLLQTDFLCAQTGQLLLYFDRFKPRELAQANLEDVISLTLGEFECLHQRRLGLVGLANDFDDFVNVQQYRLATLENMDAVIHLAQAVLGAAGDGVEAKADPLAQNIA